MDLLTGMVLMSIIIGMVFIMLINLNKSTIEFSNVNSKILEFELLRTDLEFNSEKSNRISEYPYGVKLISEFKEIIYQKSDNYLLRKEGVNIDTLSGGLVELKSYKNFNNDVYIVEFHFLIEKKEIKLYIYKSYDNQILMNEKLLSGS